jgi:hypothetical protein
MKHIIVPLFVVLIVRESAGSTSNLRFASPLQSLTIWDDQVENATPRSRFLPKFRAGLKAEVETRKALKARNEQALVKLEEQGGDWAKKAAALERRQRRDENRLCEEAYDEAIKSFTSQQKESLKKTRGNTKQYQFVGVINSASSASKPVTWYARKKPENGKWSLRLVHVNRDAIIKDLFNRGKVDVFARYKNTGESDEETHQRIVKTDYIVKERSWRYVRERCFSLLTRFRLTLGLTLCVCDSFFQDVVELFSKALFYRFLGYVLERAAPSFWSLQRRKYGLRDIVSVPRRPQRNAAVVNL